jgi:hypothetical protein
VRGGRSAERKYWFATGDCERLELLQVEAIDHRVKNETVFYNEKRQPATVEVYRPEGVLIAGNVKLGV